MFEKQLTIVIITYNRARQLENTLESLFNSPMKNVPVSVLNNASTDNTADVCKKYVDKPNFNLVTNKFNIGADANILRAYEQADTPYLWVMSDDDKYDFSNIDDLSEVLQSEQYDIIQLGSTVYESDWKFGGRGAKIKEMMADGYNFFRLSSNIACSIVKTELIRKHIISGYFNIANRYPHMPIFIRAYESNLNIYITQKRILSIVIGSENYSHYDFIKGWTDTSLLLKNKSDRKRFILCQFPEGRTKVLAGCYLSLLKKGRPSLHTIRILWNAMPWKNKLGSFFIIPFRYFEIKKDIAKAKAKS